MVSSMFSLARHEYSEEHPGSSEPPVGPADDRSPPSAYEVRGKGRATGLLPKPEPLALLEMHGGHRQAGTSEPLLVFATKLPGPDAESRPVESAGSYSADSKNKPPLLRKPAARDVAWLLIIFWTGVAATLAWQSYGDGIRETVAGSYLQLGWLAPEAVIRVETLPGSVIPAADPIVSPDLITPTGSASPSPDSVAPATPATSSAAAISSPDFEQLKTMSVALAAVQELGAELVATQQRMASDIAKLQAGQQDILEKISTPSPQPAVAPARKPIPGPPPKSQTTPGGALTVRSSHRSAQPSFP
jgi:hypothetical protein